MAGYREFQTGEVLTAANVNDFLMNQSVMVFADATARTAALSGALIEGMLTYNLDTQSLEVYDGTAFVAVGGAMKEKRIAAFTGSGNWTVPAGVTYGIAYILGGGAGSYGRTSTTPVAGSSGGNSSVAFPGGTVTALGGVANTNLGSGTLSADFTQAGVNAQNNSGKGGGRLGRNNNPIDNSQTTGSTMSNAPLGDAVQIVAGGAVTPADVIAVTVGAGGVGGGTTTKGGDGGSGYVYIEYYEEV